MHDLTIKEYAAEERVDPSTVRRWIAKGAIEIRRTPGGGIRIPNRVGHAVILRLHEPGDADKRAN